MRYNGECNNKENDATMFWKKYPERFHFGVKIMVCDKKVWEYCKKSEFINCVL